MAQMTISQALRRAKTVKGQIAEATARASQGVSYLKDKQPAFSYSSQYEELAKLRDELINLKAAVAVANATTTIDWGGKTVTLVWAVRTLEEFKGHIAWLGTLNVRTQRETTEVSTTYEYDDDSKRVARRVEEHWVCDLPEMERAVEVRQFQTDYDKLNDLVETANHKTNIAL